VQTTNGTSDFAKKVMPSAGQNELERAVAMLTRTLLEGLRHGYFEFTVSGEVIKGDKRRVLIKAGKSHAYIVDSRDCAADSA